MSVKLRVIDDVALEKLSKESKVCIIISDLVYDVTPFIDHPGGYDVFKDYQGKDATEGFNEIGHSINAQQMMRKYLIGIKKDTKEYKKYVNTEIVENDIKYINYYEEELEETNYRSDDNNKNDEKNNLNKYEYLENSKQLPDSNKVRIVYT
ncbi:cytochrome b5, putative [Hepatocystis sp. ex Piliocolobus tephrosceles]|nr:cytochrome b5, putative [Hepatocystis sp. ex Piliocolobus tephrosceles]